jgi:Lon protease-like protein
MKLYRAYAPTEMPRMIPVFPLAGALLLPRRPMPLNIFEPRYLEMIDDALGGERIVGVIQPSAGEAAVEPRPELYPIGCAGRITQFAETGDGRCFVTLTGVARFGIVEEPHVLTPYRQARVDFSPFARDFHEGYGENDVDRQSLLAALKQFAEVNRFRVDWEDIERASNEALVNGLSMLSPYGAREKQALLEAETLKARAEILVAITHMELAKAADAPSQIH